jgi:hypothetical protein
MEDPDAPATAGVADERTGSNEECAAALAEDEEILVVPGIREGAGPTTRTPVVPVGLRADEDDDEPVFWEPPEAVAAVDLEKGRRACEAEVEAPVPAGRTELGA